MISEHMSKPYRFRIEESYTPVSIPMERLAEYMRVFAQLLGERESVHFENVIDASVGLVARVDVPAQPKVDDRLRAMRAGNPPSDMKKAFKELDEMLRADNAVGSLDHCDDAVIIQFPGKARIAPVLYGPFDKEAVVQGQLVKLGGRDSTVHAELKDGATIYSRIEMKRSLAMELRELLFGPLIRLKGTGRFSRSAEGVWIMEAFKAQSFEVLDDAPLSNVVGRLRSVTGSQWAESADAVGELLDMRRDNEAAH
jgi:hypothetical protein